MPTTTARKGTKFQHCERHAPWFAGETRRRQIECMVEGGPGGWSPGCRGGECKLWPGTDAFYEASCHGEMVLDWTKAVQRFIVIENTPGYLPEDDDPFITEDYAAAVAYLNERAASYADDPDANYEVTYGCASNGNYAAVMVKDLDREHDLGRWIAIEQYEEDDA